ncbi:MAG: sel1 repeat family protein [Gammaproteobacteria bacterium]|jgi:TPR repeat protein|nr:sel1 repeat family protein [Gammaproteobacteria bacterium]
MLKYLTTTILLTLPLAALAKKTPAQTPAPTLSHSAACVEEYQLNQFNEAFQHCLSAAQANDPVSQYLVGMMYKRGKGVALNQSEAIKWFTKAAQAGNAASQLRLGKIYSIGNISSPDYVKAVSFFTQAAKQNDHEAQFALALCYQNGLGVNKDLSQSLYWYQQAIQNGLDAPKLSPEQIHSSSINLKNAPGSEEFKMSHGKGDDGFVWLKLAAEKGHMDAQYQVAMHYFNGTQTDQDDAKAFSWFQKSAEQDYAPAKSFLAWMSFLGIGTTPSQNDAIQWYVSAHQAQENNHLEFSENLPSTRVSKASAPMLFEQALRIIEDKDEHDFSTGITLLQQAANFNHHPAQAYLAKLYQTGSKVNQNAALAAKWYEKAARNGNSDAQYALGWIYFHGEGVTKNLTQSFLWFNEAAKFGGARAKSAKQFVTSHMSSAQIAQAEKLTQQMAKK